MTLRFVRFVCVVVLLGLVAVGCGSDSVSKPASPPEIFVPIYPWEGVSDGADFKGTISFDGECLLIGLTLPIFPDELTSWDGSARELTFDGEVYREGDSVNWGGGELTLEQAGRFATDNLLPNHRACGAEGAWLVGP
ncbi:MAG: hypothetical protein V3V01_04875 [Acidimicrobiales bacterium]